MWLDSPCRSLCRFDLKFESMSAVLCFAESSPRFLACHAENSWPDFELRRWTQARPINGRTCFIVMLHTAVALVSRIIASCADISGALTKNEEPAICVRYGTTIHVLSIDVHWAE